MGQRSQIYVKANGNLIIANYYQWNYGERMVSRARYGIERLKYFVDGGYDWAFTMKSEILRTSRIFDVNFDMRDVAISCDIVKEHDEYSPETDLSDYLFAWQDNNDGQLLIDVDTEHGTIKYALIDEGSIEPMDAEQYMNWDCPGWDEKKEMNPAYAQGEDEEQDMIRYTRENILEISKMAQLMTPEEVAEFKIL